jgi:hypothetical protein
MESIINWLLGRKHVEHKEAPGIGLAIQTLEDFVGRTFMCPETAPKTSGIHREEILELIQEKLPPYYDYTTRVKTYLDRKGISQAQIEIIGNIAISKRYNPLDKTFHIRSEPPNSLDTGKGQP